MLIREVSAGHLADGAKLPPERDMAADLGISVGTLRKSLADMEEKGLLRRVQGSGNYIRAKADIASVYALFRLERTAGGGLPTAHVLTVARLPKPAAAPDFGPSDHGHMIRRLRYLDADLVALEEIWLDASYRATITAEDLSESLYLYYRNALDLVISTVEDRISVGVIPEWAPARFQLQPGTAAGYIARISRTATGDPVEFSHTWFDPARARYVSRLGRG